MTEHTKHSFFWRLPKTHPVPPVTPGPQFETLGVNSSSVVAADVTPDKPRLFWMETVHMVLFGNVVGLMFTDLYSNIYWVETRLVFMLKNHKSRWQTLPTEENE